MAQQESPPATRTRWQTVLQQMIRFRLARRLFVVVFGAIVLIEAIIAIPSYYNARDAQLAEYRALARITLDAITSDGTPLGERELRRLSAVFEQVLAATLFDANGNPLASIGEAPLLPPEAGDTIAEFTLLDFNLPRPEPPSKGALAQLLQRYAATPGFAPAPLGLESLAQLLWLGNGVTGRSGAVRLRAAPSAGALYAGELYVIAERVTGLAPGVYSYHVGEHALCRLREGRPSGSPPRTSRCCPRSTGR